MANKFAITTLVAVVALGGAWLAYHNIGGTSGHDMESDREGWFLPELRDQVNEVRRIEFIKDGNTVTAISDGSAWTTPDYAGYPLRFDSVREFLLQVASLKDAEQKTSNPARHADLGLAATVEPPADGNSYAAPQPATLVKLWTDGPNPELALWVGRSKWQPTQGVYVRMDGDNQCWAASGQLRTVDDLKRWMDTKVVSMAAADVASVAILGDLDTTIQRADAEAEFACDLEVPVGREWKPVNPFSAITSSLSWTNFDSVEAADGERYQSVADRTITWTAFDGTAITAELWRTDSGCWAKFNGEEHAKWAYSFPAAKADVWFQTLEDWSDEAVEEESTESEEAVDQPSDDVTDQSVDESSDGNSD